MARIRSIKPEFFTSEDICSLSPLARLMYIALWCEADREGRLEWKPGTFKLRYFPGDNVDTYELAAELEQAELVIPYTVNGKEYAEIPGFAKHQVINNREQDSSIPPRVKDASGTRESGVSGEGKEGREGKGKDHAEYTREFEEFWDRYPKKVGKGDAFRAWKKINPGSELRAKILWAVDQQKRSEQWQRDRGQYVPNPATWLNQARWDDEPEAGAQATAPPRPKEFPE